MAYPRDHAVPLAFLGRGIIDQHAVQGAVAAVAAIVPDPVLADAGHDKEIRCDPFVDDAGRRPLLGQERGGRIVVGLATDCTVRSARRSSVKNRRPVPPSGAPASRVKIETGMSTLVPVLGISYRRHSVSPAKASAGVKAKTAKAADRRYARMKRSPVQFETIESIGVRSSPRHF
jgi:hypothetical protein